MKTSVIEVRAMLAVLNLDEVEKRLCDVPGVESATVNFAAGKATVRFDETRLDLADIKSHVRQHGSEDDAATTHATGDHKDKAGAGASPEDAAPMTMKDAPVAAATPAAGPPLGKEAASSTPQATAKTTVESAPATADAMPAKN